jgi:hypothetical protein
MAVLIGSVGMGGRLEWCVAIGLKLGKGVHSPSKGLLKVTTNLIWFMYQFAI